MDQICIIKLIKDKGNLSKFVNISIFLLSSLCNNNSSYEILWFDYKSTNFLSSRNFPRFQRNKLTQFVIITISQGALYEICIPTRTRGDVLRECPENLMRCTTGNMQDRRSYNNVVIILKCTIVWKATRLAKKLFLISMTFQEICEHSLSVTSIGD